MLLLSLLLAAPARAVQVQPEFMQEEAAFTDARKKILERRGSLERSRCEAIVRQSGELEEWQRVALLVDCNSSIERTTYEKCRANVLTALAGPAAGGKAGAVLQRELYARVVNGCAHEYLSAYDACLELRRLSRAPDAEASCAELQN